VDMFCVAPMRQQSSFINLEMNQGSLLLITFLGSSNLGNTCQKYRSATPSALMDLLRGMNIAILVQS
jgi:hypothetical protein